MNSINKPVWLNIQPVLKVIPELVDWELGSVVLLNNEICVTSGYDLPQNLYDQIVKFYLGTTQN